MTMDQGFNRHTFPPIPIGSGKRQGLYLHLQEVDGRSKTGRAFKGRVISPGKETDLPVGGIIVQKRPEGTAQFATWNWSYCLVPEQDQIWEWSPECPDERFISFRDTVAEALSSAPTNDANGYRPDPSLATPREDNWAETALSMARHAFTQNAEQHPERGDQYLSVSAGEQPPRWLIRMTNQSNHPATTALNATLALVCNVNSPEPVISWEDETVYAIWDDGEQRISLSAHADGTVRARRATDNQPRPSEISLQLLRLLINKYTESQC